MNRTISAFAARLRRFGCDEGGATSIEYAVIASCISIAVLGAVNALGSNVKTTFYNKLASMF